MRNRFRPLLIAVLSFAVLFFISFDLNQVTLPQGSVIVSVLVDSWPLLALVLIFAAWPLWIIFFIYSIVVALVPITNVSPPTTDRENKAASVLFWLSLAGVLYLCASILSAWRLPNPFYFVDSGPGSGTTILLANLMTLGLLLTLCVYTGKMRNK